MRAFHQPREHAVRGADFLRHRARAQHKRAQIAHRAGPHFLVAQKTARIEFVLQTPKETRNLLLGGGHTLAGADAAGFGRIVDAQPFPADDQHGLREVERGEVGVDRERHHRVGERDFVVLQPRALGAEQETDALACGNRVARGGDRVLRTQDGLHHVAVARTRGVDARKVANGGFERIEHARLFEHAVGARTCPRRARVGKIAARFDQAKVEKAAIEHGTRRRADVLGQLRAHQNDRGRAGHSAGADAPSR